MSQTSQPIDTDRLREEVQIKYREVANEPGGDYHFHTGRAHARRLGYPASPLDQLPEAACEAFAGVANPFHWDHPQPGDHVVDLGSGAGMDAFLAALWVGPEGTVVGASGEAKAHQYGTWGYPVRARSLPMIRPLEVVGDGQG